MELTSNHQIYYSNKQLLPLSDVAESLMALEKLIKQSPHTIEKFFPGLKIYDVEVYLNELQSGSLWEDIVVKFIFGSQAKFDEVIASTREKIGLKYLIDKPKLLSAILLALLLYGGYKALASNPNSSPQSIQNIQINNNIVVQAGAELAEMEPEEFQFIIEDSVDRNGSIAKNAIKFVKPAKRDPSASITFDDTANLSISPEAVSAMPGYLEDEIPEETIQEFQNIEISIRATDLDHKRSGWGAVIPSISDRRTRLQLDPTIDTEMLIERRKVVGEVTAVFRYTEEGEKIPKLYFLRNIVK
ncbi:MAG TPA: hypothetical protein DDY32_08505 [Desulfobulbaceae bacterium]|nr:hypothetical protein [Desulfobulbaceae bacterium]